ncbi:CRAL-TRIO domain-containing protein [Melampsora americana]|nr:CRAL-TRIO domain-containing protein [Melampsora americana]
MEKLDERPDEICFTDGEMLALKGFWTHLFDLLELNSATRSLVVDSPIHNETKELISRHGAERYAEALWRYTMLEDPDYTVIRFIRARKLNVENAIKMFIECLKWRIESDIDEMMAKGAHGIINQEGYDGAAFLLQIKSGKTFLQGFSKIGGPVSYLFPRLHKTAEQSMEVMTDFTNYAMENIRMFTTNLRAKKIVVIDLKGFGLSNMDWKATLYFNKCLEAYYPETLELVIIHNAPWVFHGVWKALGPMLDPVVRSKIMFSKSSQDLLTHVDKRYLLKEVGGESTWKPYHRETPAPQELDQTKKEELLRERNELVAKYIELTNQWTDQGSATEAELRSYLGLMMRAQGLLLDPYLRAGTFYHHEGNLLPNGLVGFCSEAEHKDWEYKGQAWAREQILAKIEDMKTRFIENGVDYPVFNLR